MKKWKAKQAETGRKECIQKIEKENWKEGVEKTGKGKGKERKLRIIRESEGE